jgi:hypothetical protein
MLINRFFRFLTIFTISAIVTLVSCQSNLAISPNKNAIASGDNTSDSSKTKATLFMADLGFRPETDGFSFENYGIDMLSGLQPLRFQESLLRFSAS